MSEGTPPGDRWLVLYDADCGLCKWLLAGLLRWDRQERLQPLPLDDPKAARLLSDLEPAERMASWHLVEPSGDRRSAGDALAPLLAMLPGGRLPSAALGRVPALTGRGYRLIAERRAALSSLVPARAKNRAAMSIEERRGPRSGMLPDTTTSRRRR